MSPHTAPQQANVTPGLRQFAPLAWLALGTFATGTESFMIAALLPGLAHDLTVSLTAAGQLMTVFGFTYAISSPVLSALTAGIGRRNLLLAAMAAFALANFFASSTDSFWGLMAARVLLAAAAGLYVPSASALAGAVVTPERRGTALAIVNGGTSIAVALGVPLGALIGHGFGWRATFFGVGIMATVAVAGLFVGIPRGIDKGLSAPSIRERVAVVRQAPILIGLLVTALWATGAYTVYTYFTPYLVSVTGISGAHIGVAFFVWGASAVMGLFIGGTLSDKFGSRAVMIPAFTLLALAFVSLSAIGAYLSGVGALVAVTAAIVVWGLSAWGFFPAQQLRLIQVAGVKTAPIALSLNASFMYLGFSLGAALGSVTLLHAPLTALGVVGAACEVAALAIVLLTVPRLRTARLQPAAGTQ
ncbi:MAG TPA: MFS transporter [Xanthobacteraceae bacterium]|nr:MFS transporter [Xanthobacteraceae bacterium]